MEKSFPPPFIKTLSREVGEDVSRVSSLLEFWAFRRRSAEVRNTLDKPESRLSARLPGIMDVTVTHINEARHLHLPHYHHPPRRAFDGCGEETSTSSCCVSFDPNRPPSHRLRINIHKDERRR